MASAALVIDNLADASAGAVVGASSQVLTMPVTNLQTPSPSERWRSLSSNDYFVLDKGESIEADTVMVGGLTCGPNATVRLRLSTLDDSGATGDVLDTGNISNGDAHFDIEYGMFLWRLAAPAEWRYARFDISDPDATFVEAGCILDGLSEAMAYNFVPGGTFQHNDRSRVATTSSGITLTWPDNTYRSVNLSFDFVTATQRYGLVERLDRVKGIANNVLLITDPDSENLPRDSVWGLVTNPSPISFGPIPDIFGKQLQINERI
jgi:hypothetical protein